MSKNESKKEEVQEIVEKPSAGSTALVAVLTIIIVLLIAVVAVLLVSRMQDNRSNGGEARERVSEIIDEAKEDVLEEREDNKDELEDEDELPTPDGMERYTNTHYGFSLVYDEDFDLCLNDFCDNDVPDREIQHVKINDPDDYANGHEFYLRILPLASERSADEFGEASMECVENSDFSEVVSVNDDFELYGYDAYTFTATGGYCDEGYMISKDGEIVDGDGYQGFLYERGELNIGYAIIDDNLVRGIVPDEEKFTDIWDSLILTK